MLPSLLQTFSIRELFASECSFPEVTLTPQCRSAFSNKHVVFVDGLFNEAAQLVGNYFCDNITEAERVGFSYSHLGYLSSVSIPENADKLFVDIQRIYAQLQKPILLIGHSKGGAECLYTVLKYPELLLSNIIDRVVVIHGAIGGSHFFVFITYALLD
jgi:triacylglycerol esterase/lipase EstA (alpha/beta hydrolase family)